jgi:flavin-dependent dehydrogenase
LGVRCHFVVPPWSTRVEVYWSDGAEAYVTPVSAEHINVAFLWEGGRASFTDLLRRFPRLAQRLGGARAEGAVRGAGPFCQRVRRRYANGVALVGDAAGYVDAITGEGLSLGFRSAEALVETVATGRPLGDYEERYVQLSRPYYRMTALLLLLARWPRLRRRVLRVLAEDSELFTRLLAVSNGDEPCRVRTFVPVLRRLATARL